MTKETYYDIPIGLKISEEQKKKIDSSGLKTSEFVRNAIDFFTETRLNATSNIKINVIDECITELNNLKESVKINQYSKFNNSIKNVKSLNNFEENVKQNEDLVYKENEPNEPEKKVLNNSETEKFNNNEENVKSLDFEEWLKKDHTLVQTISNLINIHGTIEPKKIVFLASKHNLSTRELRTFIDTNYDELRNMQVKRF